MELLPSYFDLALPGAAVLLLTWLVLRLRQRQASPARKRGRHTTSTRQVAAELDTVAGWPPQAARVLNRQERQALELLRGAVPGRMVLAQVPLSRFLRVPPEHSYAEWLQRVGTIGADLLVCDTDGRVRVVVDIRAAQESTRSRQRHERMARVLRAAGIHVCVWREGALPTALNARSELAELLPLLDAQGGSGTSRPMPLIPVPEIEEVLANGDDERFAEFDARLEPVPSTFFQDLDPAPEPAGR